jgi:hypothetical protein
MIPLLHNMSASPRTQVDSAMLPVHGRIVMFSLFAFLQREDLPLPARVRKRVLRLGLGSLDDDELRRALAPRFTDALHAQALADGPPPLDGVLVGWKPLAATGSDERKPLLVWHCTDPLLTLSVLARCEGGLYLGHRRPGGTLRELSRRGLAFDDPRLARLESVSPYPPPCWPQNEQEAATQQTTGPHSMRRASSASATRPNAGKRRRAPASRKTRRTAP